MSTYARKESVARGLVARGIGYYSLLPLHGASKRKAVREGGLLQPPLLCMAMYGIYAISMIYLPWHYAGGGRSHAPAGVCPRRYTCV